MTISSSASLYARTLTFRKIINAAAIVSVPPDVRFFPPLKIFPDYIVLQVQSLVLSVLHRAQFDMVS